MNAAAAPLTLPLAAVSAADSAVRAHMLDVRHRPARLYLLLLVVGARRGGPPAGGPPLGAPRGAAGGGTAGAGAYPPCAPTASLVWLAVDPYTTVVASRSAAVEDCREVVRVDGVIDETAPPAFAGDVLAVPFSVGPPPLEARRVACDRRAPQRGLTGNFDRP